MPLPLYRGEEASRRTGDVRPPARTRVPLVRPAEEVLRPFRSRRRGALDEVRSLPSPPPRLAGTDADPVLQSGTVDGDDNVLARAKDALRPRPFRPLPIRRTRLEPVLIHSLSPFYNFGGIYVVFPASSAAKNLSFTPSLNPRPMRTSFGVTSSSATALRGTSRMSNISRTPWRTYALSSCVRRKALVRRMSNSGSVGAGSEEGEASLVGFVLVGGEEEGAEEGRAGRDPSQRRSMTRSLNVP